MENRKIKVLHFAPGFLYGGIESRLLDWYSYIDRSKVKFDLLKQSNNCNDTPLIAKFRKLGGEVYNIPRFTPRNFIKYALEISLFFKEHQGEYDVVHSHSLSTGFFVMYYAKKYGVKKRILHSRTSKTDGSFIKRNTNNLLKSLACLYATDYFACSKLAGYWGFGRDRMDNNKVRQMKNGVQLSKFEFNVDVRKQTRIELGVDDKFVIGNVCRLTEAKNFPFILNLFSQLLQVEPNAILLIVGDGPLLEAITKKTIELSIENSVIMCGRKENVAKYYMAMDVLFSPSLWEGFPGTILEAQASGLPCIISSTITEEIKMSDNLLQMDLDRSVDTWIKEIVNFKNQDRKTDVIEIIRAKGYDSEQVVKELQQYYLDEA